MLATAIIQKVALADSMISAAEPSSDSSSFLVRLVLPTSCSASFFTESAAGFLKYSKARLLVNRYLTFQVLSESEGLSLAAQIVRDPPAIPSMPQIPISDENWLRWNIHFFQVKQPGEILLLRHQLVNVGVQRRTEEETYSFRPSNKHEKYSAPTFLNFKVAAPCLVWVITACHNISASSHSWVQFFAPKNDQVNPRTDYSYLCMRSSCPSCILDYTIFLLNVRS